MTTEHLLFALVTFLGGLLITILGHVWLTRERAAEKEREDQREELNELDRRMHAEEKVTIRQDGEIARMQDANGRITRDLEDLASTVATKADVDRVERSVKEDVQNLSRLLEKLLPQKIVHPSGGYQSPSPRTVPRVDREDDIPEAPKRRT